MTRKIKFVCPKCSRDILCVHQLAYEALKIDEEMEDDKYLTTEYTLDYEIDSVFKYTCGDCGKIIGYTEEEVCDWLIKNGMTEVIDA